MKIVIPIIGAVAVIVQMIRFWPLTFTTLLTSLVTGAVFYIACKLGWDTQRGRILKDGYKGWGNWCKRVVLGLSVFLTLSLVVIFFSFHNPICAETGDPFYGRCEKYSDEHQEAPADISFNLVGKAIFPLLLAGTFIVGSAAVRIEHLRKKGLQDRRVSPREY